MGLERLNIIGNGDAFGTGGRYHTCFYLESSETKFLVDIGATAIHNLQFKVELNDINLIIISHLHGDHFGGIPFFLLNSAFHTNRQEPLTIMGPKGCEERIRSLNESLYMGITHKLERFDLNIIEYETGVIQKFNDLEILALPAIHSDESSSHCLQITSGETKFAYSGDTEWTDDLNKIADFADYFICECTYYSSTMDGHLNYLELDNKLKGTTAKNILLTHLSQEMLDSENQSKVRFDLAEEGIDYRFLE
jgi:ribonuclease BN (tRNA processing enzyme)